MDGLERRDMIMEVLREKTQAITGTQMAKMFEVSRQVIVQDVALLRAQGVEIISTSEGYRIYKVKTDTFKRVFCVKHPEEAIEDELYIIVDNGGLLLNTIVSHLAYGEISVDMHLSSRRQVNDFLIRTLSKEFVPLMTLTKGNHYHTVEAKSESILDVIEKELRQKGYLVEE